MSPRGHEAWEELVAGHALGALEPEDEQALLAHLPGCARCERELASYRGTAAALAAAAPPVELPPGMADRLRAAVQAESPDAFRAATAPVDLASRRRAALASPRRRALLAAAASVAVLVAGLSGTSLLLQQQAQQQLARGDRLAEAVRALGDSAGRSIPLRGGDEEVAAVAVLHGTSVSLVVDGLAPSGEDSTYVLWEVSRFGAKRALGTFEVRGEGVEVLRDLPLHSPASDVAALAVTAEQGDEAPPAPGSAPVAVGAVPA